jgi:hypothetical protein
MELITGLGRPLGAKSMEFTRVLKIRREKFL